MILSYSTKLPMKSFVVEWISGAVVTFAEMPSLWCPCNVCEASDGPATPVLLSVLVCPLQVVSVNLACRKTQRLLP